MSIVDAIKKLREQLTGEPGKGASITDAINDLTEGLTGEPGVGASISDAISNLADHADDISGGGGGGTGVPVAPVLPMTELSADGWTEQSAEGIYLYTRNLTSENTAFPKYLYVTGTIAEPVIAFPGNEGEIDGEISMGYEGARINVSGISDPIPLLINKSETSGKMELVIFSESGQITTMPVISLQIDQVLP